MCLKNVEHLKANAIDYQIIFVVIDWSSSNRMEVKKALQTARKFGPIIAISSTECGSDRALAYEFGASMCLSQPLHGRELEMAVLAALRDRTNVSSNIIRSGPISLDLDTQDFCVSDARLALTRKEYLVLERLMLTLGQTVSRAKLMDHLYGFDEFPEQKIVDVLISKIRKKLGNFIEDRQVIRTVRSLGYRIDKPQNEKLVSE